MSPDRFPPLPAETARQLLNTIAGYEPDWLLILPYVPHEERGFWLSILAIASELLVIPGKVSTPLLGDVRLQWWREALDEVFGETPVRRHPVVEALDRAMRGRPAAADRLRAAIDGMQPFLTPDDETSLDRAMGVRKAIFDPLAEELGANGGGEAFALHALARSSADRSLAPGPEGVEAPRSRFSRGLASHPELGSQLAEAIRNAKARRSDDPASLLLALLKTESGQVKRIDNPLHQRWAIFRAAIMGRS
ncbi:MAG: squalene/phytoene synthase family protein [Pseudomonadota bacterium]